MVYLEGILMKAEREKAVDTTEDLVNSGKKVYLASGMFWLRFLKTSSSQ